MNPNVPHSAVQTQVLEHQPLDDRGRAYVSEPRIADLGRAAASLRGGPPGRLHDPQGTLRASQNFPRRPLQRIGDGFVAARHP